MRGLAVVCEGGRTEHGSGPPPAAPASLGLTRREGALFSGQAADADPGGHTIAEGTDSARVFANSKQLLLTPVELAKFTGVSADSIRGILTEEDIRDEITPPKFKEARDAHTKRADGAERALSDGLRQEREVLERSKLQAETELETKAGEQITALLQGQTGYDTSRHDAPVRDAQRNAVSSVAGAVVAALSRAEPCLAAIRTETSGSMLKNTGEEVREAFVAAQAAYQSGRTSCWRDCHSPDALSPSLLKHLLQAEGGAAE